MQYYLRSINANHLKESIDECYFDTLSIYQNVSAMLFACSVYAFECNDDVIRFEDKRIDDIYLDSLQRLRRQEPIIQDFISHSCEIEEAILKNLAEYIDLFFNECVNPNLSHSIAVSFNHKFYWDIAIKAFIKEQRELDVSHRLESYQLPRVADSRQVILDDIRRELTRSPDGYRSVSPHGSF